MKQMLAICLFELKRMLKKPRSYLLMFALPLLFTFVFGGLIGGGAGTYNGVPIALVDLDNSTVSKGLTEQLQKEKLMSIRLNTLDQAKQLIEKKKISGVITIPKGFEAHLLAGEKASVQFDHSPDLAAASVIKQVLDNGAANAAIQVKGAQDWSRFSKEKIDWKEAYRKLAAGNRSQGDLVKSDTVSDTAVKKMSNVSERAAGFSIMFIMITLITVTGVFLDARKNGVWSRILSTPSSRLSIVGGYLLSFFLIGWFQFASLMFLTSLFFGISWGNLWAQAVLISSFLLCTVGLGVAIAGFVRTSEQQAAIGNLLIVSTCMLGGVYWPLEVVPKFMQKIAEFVPQTWAMRGFSELVARGGGIADIWGPIAILLGFAVVFLAMGISSIRYE